MIKFTKNYDYEAHEKGENGWFPSYLINGWLREG
jgi:hypothetical protein